jgi:hypothetical protein
MDKNKKINRLLKKITPMSEKQKHSQRKNFVYGNLKVENKNITKKLVDTISDKIYKNK